MKKDIPKYLLRGFLWGNTILVINLVLAEAQVFDLTTAILMENFAFTAIVFMFFGFGVGTTTIIYDIDRFNLLQKTALHFTIAISAHTIAILALGMLSVANAFASTLNFLVVFILVWTGFYIYGRYEAKKINQQLTKRNMENN
jgi:uncharacterized membrane protein